MKNLIKFIFLTISSLLLIAAVNLTDPTRPPQVPSTTNTTATPKQLLTVSAIFIYPNYKLAIINSQTVTIGDHINEYIVTTINPDTVELTGPQNSKEVLRLFLPVKQRK